MHDVALKLLLKSGEYDTETREWLNLTDYQQTWRAWKTAFKEAYVAKRRSEAARDVEDKPFCGYSVNNAHKQLHQRGHTTSDLTASLKNQLLDSIKGYLDNISVAATQAVAKGYLLAELSASVAI